MHSCTEGHAMRMIRRVTGSQIRKIREARGETQAVFGTHFGVDQSTIHRWETNGITDRGVTRLAIERVLSELKPLSSR
jgi:DNA-binding transcriptional regulator YiaG